MSEIAAPVRLRTVAAVSLIFTYLFFIEYLPPWRRVFIPYDLENFHYPLAGYAFQSLRQGRFPEWDPATYCGLSFAGNIQAALFYPPTWLLFAANLGRRTLSYQSLQTLAIAHVWLAFLLCYAWLRRKRLAELSCVLGAGVFAFSGYMLTQLQHLGVVSGYAWMPLGLLAIDQALEERRWRPLWKLVLASAMCFLAGYPPTWFVFAVSTVTYAAWRWKMALAAIAALGLSLLVAMVQLLPTWQATALKEPESRYGTGFRDPRFFLSYLLPNYSDFGLHANPPAQGYSEYLYLGAPAFLGLAYLARRRGLRPILPPAGVAAVSLILVTNPFDLVSRTLRHWPLLDQVCRDYYFLAGIALAAAPLAAIGLDRCLEAPRRPAPRWLVPAAIVLAAAWSVRELLVWLPLGSDFPSGWRSAIQPAITLALFTGAMIILPAGKGARRTALIAAVLLVVAVDYKVFGTSRRFNAEEGRGVTYSLDSFPAMDDAAFRQLRANRHFRIAVDLAPFPQILRHVGLATPQGFDPFLTVRYKKVMERIAHFRTNWDLDIDPANHAALRLLGIRHFITSEVGPLRQTLAKDPAFRLVGSSEPFYKVYEFTGARPPYGWVEEDGKRSARLLRWEPEARGFLVRSDTGGRLALTEQFFPGWRATVDGAPASIDLWAEAFQAVWVPAGEHRVEFTYRSSELRLGAVLSLAALAALALALRSARPSDRGLPAVGC